MSNEKRYLIEIPGLQEGVEAAPVDDKHAALMRLLRRHEMLEDCRLATNRGDSYLGRRSVLNAAGELIAADHEAWLAEQLQADSGNVVSTARRLRALGYSLTEIAIDNLYFIHDRGGPQDNFVQVEIMAMDERVDRALFAEHEWGWERAKTLADLVRLAEDGERRGEADRDPVGSKRYQLRRVIDMAAFVSEAAEHEAKGYRARGAKRIMVSTNGGPSAPMTVSELAGAQPPFVWRGLRLFNDWASSSAGAGGHRICESWAMQISDYTSREGDREMSLIPLWTHTRKMAAIERMPKSAYELFGKLESIDRRLGVPFAWFFYMLHGNLVQSWAGEAILSAAEKGLIVLPERDYRVLKAWDANSYAF